MTEKELFLINDILDRFKDKVVEELFTQLQIKGEKVLEKILEDMISEYCPRMNCFCEYVEDSKIGCNAKNPYCMD